MSLGLALDDEPQHPFHHRPIDLDRYCRLPHRVQVYHAAPPQGEELDGSLDTGREPGGYSMQRLWQGVYLDGRTAIGHPVTIQLTGTTLHITKVDGTTLEWPYAQVTHIQGSYKGDEVRLEYGTPPAQALVVQGTEFLAAVQQASSTNGGHLRDPRKRRVRVGWTVPTSLALIGVIAGLYFKGVPALAIFLAPHVPLSWEEHLGNSAFEQLAPATLHCTDPYRQAFIEQILHRLRTTVPDSPYRLRVTIVDQPGINAFALPGGRIVVLRGLLEATDGPEQLAGVLAHEVQHIFKRHSTHAVLDQGSTSLLIAAVTGDFTEALAYGIEGARVLGMLRYSRLHEDEADREGFLLLHAAGIDPAEMIAFYRTMEATQPHQTESPSFVSTHPDAGNRIANLAPLSGRLPFRAIPLLPGADWKDIRSICAHRTAAPSSGSTSG